MPTLSIKNVPTEMLEELRARAAQHHRSIQGELMALLSALFEPARSRAADAPAESSRPEAKRRSGTRRIEEIAAEHRKRWKKPFRQRPRAVDVIRAERDGR